MPIRWRIAVELTFDIDEEKDVKQYDDDVDEDVARRALRRVRPALNDLVGEGKAFAHYHIIDGPKRNFDA